MSTGTKKSKHDSLCNLSTTTTTTHFSRPLFTSLPSEVQRGLLIGPMQARKKFAEGQQRLKEYKLSQMHLTTSFSTTNTKPNDTFQPAQNYSNFNPMKRSLDDAD